MIGQKNVLGNSRPSDSSTLSRRAKKKKHGSLKQIQLNVEGNIENTNVFATEATVAFAISPSLTLVSGSSIQNNNTNAMLVGYNIANPPGYTTP
jgi:hypothetical protein